MLSRIWRVTHPLLTLTLVGCCAYLLWRESRRSAVARPAPAAQTAPNPVRPTLPTDVALRRFLNVRSIGGTCELPEGENYGVIALLYFEDGKFRERLDAWQIKAEQKATRAISYQIMWGKGPGGESQLVGVVRMPTGDTTSPPRKMPLLSKLNGHSMRHNVQTEEVRGYRVLGHAVSSAVRPPDRLGVSFGRPADDIKNWHAVAIIGVKTFPTFEQACNCWSAREPSDP
jgi:hypothetical protein